MSEVLNFLYYIISVLRQTDVEQFQKLSAIASGFGFIVAAIALAINAKANRANTKVRRATFWLDIRKMFTEHNDVYMKLQKGGPWYQSDKQPADPQDRTKVIAYLSLLEQVKAMLDKGLIDKKLSTQHRSHFGCGSYYRMGQ
jgi:hypothetical protein